jgi:hypothetical protein
MGTCLKLHTCLYSYRYLQVHPGRSGFSPARRPGLKPDVQCATCRFDSHLYESKMGRSESGRYPPETITTMEMVSSRLDILIGTPNHDEARTTNYERNASHDVAKWQNSTRERAGHAQWRCRKWYELNPSFLSILPWFRRMEY